MSNLSDIGFPVQIQTKVKREVTELTEKFPMYPTRYKEAKTEAISAS